MKQEKQNRKDKFMYSGKLEEYQLLGERKPVTEYEVDNYSQYQNYLYKRALYGLNALTEEELAITCSKKKQRITNVYKKAQVVLNNLKQQLTIKYTNELFKTFFPNSTITQALLDCTETDLNFRNTLTFKDLNISKEQIISIFISEGILPKNFMDLKEDPNQLPKLKTKSV